MLACGVSVLVGAGLLGCTAQPTTAEGFDTWYGRMQTVFQDPHSNGGGGGVSPGTVQLGNVKTGQWVVYATCKDAEVLHFRVIEGGKTQAQTDVPCGATMAMPITITPAGTNDFELQASHPAGPSGRGWWSAQVNSTSWHQAASISFG